MNVRGITAEKSQLENIPKINKAKKNQKKKTHVLISSLPIIKQSGSEGFLWDFWREKHTTEHSKCRQ